MPKKLLVADDSLTIQKVIRLALSGAAGGSSDGYEIQAVSDGNDAVQQISLFRPDVVLIDVSMPGKSAFEVKRAVNQYRDLDFVRFVLMSSAFEKVDEPQVLDVGFHGRLTKPFDPAHLREVLNQVLAKMPDRPTQPEPGAFRDERTLFMDTGSGPKLDLPPPPPQDEPPMIMGMPDLPDSGGDDIRNLTESTIRMSGLADISRELPPSVETPPEPPSSYPDDFQWSVQEHLLKPHDNMMDAGNSTFPIAPPAENPFDHSRFIQKTGSTESTFSELDLTPPPPPESSYDFSRGEFSQGAETSVPLETIPVQHVAAPTSSATAAASASAAWKSSATPARPYSPPPQQRAPAPAPVATQTPSPAPAQTPPLDLVSMQKQMEEMVQVEVEKALRKMAENLIPDVAERVIKQEIHRLLTESP